MFPGKIVREKFLILRKKSGSNFGFLAKYVDLRQQKLSTLVKTAFHVSKKNISKRNTIFIWKFSNCFTVFTIRTKTYIAFGLSANSIGKVVKTAFQLSRWSYGDQDFSQKKLFYLSFGCFIEEFPTSGELCMAILSKLLSMCPEGVIWESFSWKKNNFISNSGISSITILTKLSRLVKTAFHISTWSFWGGIFFYLKVFEIIYRFRILNEEFWIFPTCSKNFHQGCWS